MRGRACRGPGLVPGHSCEDCSPEAAARALFRAPAIPVQGCVRICPGGGSCRPRGILFNTANLLGPVCNIRPILYSPPPELCGKGVRRHGRPPHAASRGG
ncbi:hypothetical protein CENSYa_1493 [Cenarchaeum symbiosum A]|uniref:Uncharacterized protein n=1 Tax=Cenarchaeum symbiosum (strain A) TaxID=414004 RepID=A0RXP8_CENSY|nr:hypothetical protein CENSYa_1493 [Cenarchaeum symbiosum A]